MMRKTTSILIILICLFFVGCENGNSEDNNETLPTPWISDSSGIYISSKEDGNEYSITNGEMYKKLRNSNGFNSLLSLVDKDLLMKESLNGVSFWDQVTNADVEKFIYDKVFSDYSEESLKKISDSKKEDLTLSYFNTYHSEYSNLDKIYDYYHLYLAKEKYAKNILIEELKLNDFPISKYEEVYQENYGNHYYALVIYYNTRVAFNNTLLQLGIKVDGFGKWLKTTDDSELSKNEIVQAYIDLYNMQNAHKLDNYPLDKEVLKLDTHYKVNNGQYEFIIDNIKEELYYTHEEFLKLDKLTKARLKEYSVYPEGNNWHSTNYMESGMILKIGEVQITLDDKKSEIRDYLIKEKLDYLFIEEQMGLLRQKNEFVIYDDQLKVKNEYLNYGLKYEELDENKDNLVARTTNNTYTSDCLFSFMRENFGINEAINILDYKRVLYNSDINNIYSFNEKVVNEEDKILDEGKWSKLKEKVEEEKKKYADGYYPFYSNRMDWDEFLKEYYNVFNDEELLYHFLYEDLKTSISKSYASLRYTSVNDEKWKIYEREMLEKANNYFLVSGIFLQITVERYNPENYMNYTIDYDKWSKVQQDYAKNLYKDILDYLKTVEPNDYKQELRNIQSAYENSVGFALNVEHNTESQINLEGIEYKYKTIEIAKYKSVGLTLKFMENNYLSYSDYIDPFNEVLKSIWDKNPSSYTPTVYGMDEEEYKYILTEIGYFVYVNISSTDIEKWDEAENKVIPTLDQLKLYLENPNEVKGKVLSAIYTYYNGVYNLLVSEANYRYNKYQIFLEFDINYHNKDNYSEFLNNKIKVYRDMLDFE